MAVKRLRLQLNRRVDSLFVGAYKSAFRGAGLEFEDVRPYSPGDDVRRMDWKLTARQRRPYVKVFRESRELTLVLVLDVSASMRACGADRLAMTLAGALAFSAIQNGDRVGLLRFSDKLESWLPPGKSRNHLWRLLSQLHDPVGKTSKGTRLQAASMAIRQHVSRRSTLCFLSDFIFPIDESWPVLCRRHVVHGLLLCDRHDQLSSGDALVDVMDAESGRYRLATLSQLSQQGDEESRLTSLRSGGSPASLISTTMDPISALHRHFLHAENRR